MWAIAIQQKFQQIKRVQFWHKLLLLCITVVLTLGLSACGGDRPTVSKAKTADGIAETSPPPEIQRLSGLFDRYQPQLTILNPQPDQVITDTQVSVKLDVKDLPIFKNADLGLGPHVHLFIDNQDYKAVYDLNQPIVLENLSLGTHTLRAFTSRPWHESFKNEGAYTQVTFHVYAKTGENTPSPQLPLLTYSRPQGQYGAEPIMLDFYLKNAPLHLAALEDDGITDWQIRTTVNGQSFTLDRWQPIYLKGFKPGKNWIKLEFLDREGNLIPNQFNSSAHLIEYQPGGQDTLSRLVRGDAIANIESIVDPNYIAKQAEPEVIPTVEPTSIPEITPSAVVEEKPAQLEEKSVEKSSVPAVVVEEVKPTIKSESQAEPGRPSPISEPVIPVVPTTEITSDIKSSPSRNYFKSLFNRSKSPEAKSKPSEVIPTPDSGMLEPASPDLSNQIKTEVKSSSNSEVQPTIKSEPKVEVVPAPMATKKPEVLIKRHSNKQPAPQVTPVPTNSPTTEKTTGIPSNPPEPITEPTETPEVKFQSPQDHLRKLLEQAKSHRADDAKKALTSESSPSISIPNTLTAPID